VQFHDAGLAGIEGGELGEAVVERHEVGGALRREDGDIVEGDGVGPGAAAAGILFARMVHQDLAHVLRGDGDEVERPSYWG